MSNPVGEWNEWRNLVLGELERLTAEVKDLRKLIDDNKDDYIEDRQEVRDEITSLKIKGGLKATLYVAAVGFFGAMTYVIYAWIAKT